MNARAQELVVGLRAILATLPGASALGFHASEIWTLVVITADSDEAVSGLGTALGLSGPEIRKTAERWWRRATAERDHGALRVVVVGPRHRNPPPPDDVERSS
jgi:hypothetical protein